METNNRYLVENKQYSSPDLIEIEIIEISNQAIKYKNLLSEYVEWILKTDFERNYKIIEKLPMNNEKIKTSK